jgi:hypothetical protein
VAGLSGGPWSAGSEPAGLAGVLKAIVQVLTDRGEPMRAKNIHAAVEALVGEPVPRSSVKGALASDVAGSSGRLVRVARGRYVLVEVQRPGSRALP